MRLTKSKLRRALTLERTRLIALVATMTPADLDAPSLCAGWSNRNVLSHLLSFELHLGDAIRLITKRETLTSITARQTARYARLSPQQYVQLLNRGLRRTQRLLTLTPAIVFQRKIIPVPLGHISLAQLFGDIAIDRSVHYLDIAYPLGRASTIGDQASLEVAVDFILDSLDLLSSKIPQNYHGQWAQLELVTDLPQSFYWQIGQSSVTTELPAESPLVTVTTTANNLIFTVTVRAELTTAPLTITGDPALAKIIAGSFSADALWES